MYLLVHLTVRSVGICQLVCSFLFSDILIIYLCVSAKANALVHKKTEYFQFFYITLTQRNLFVSAFTHLVREVLELLDVNVHA